MPSEAMRRELRSGGRAFLQYLCDAGLTGDEASRLAERLAELRGDKEGGAGQLRVDLLWAIDQIGSALIDPHGHFWLMDHDRERLDMLIDRMGVDPRGEHVWSEIRALRREAEKADD